MCSLIQKVKYIKIYTKCVGLLKKPAVEEAPSDLAIIGRYLLTPEIFDILIIKNQVRVMKSN